MKYAEQSRSGTERSLRNVVPFVFSSLAHPKEASPGALYYSTYYQNPASVRQWLSTDSEKKKKKKAFHWLNRLSTPSSKAQRFLGCSIKEEIHSTFCARCVGTPSKGHNHKPGGFLWCFPDRGHPTREVPGLLCHCCTSLGLFWCRRGEEASGLFLGRALASRCPDLQKTACGTLHSSSFLLWHSKRRDHCEDGW